MDRTAAAAGRPIDHAAPSPLGMAPMLVGRTREQGLLRGALAAARSGRGQLVLVGGEAGIGKTTLARDLSREATASDCHLLVGACYDLTNTPPYGPWLDLFEACRHGPVLPAPPAAFAGGRLETITDQAALYAGVRDFFADLSTARPALVLLEDLHWADPASLELLRHIAPHLRQWPVLFLVTYRADELTRRHPFAQQLPALVREAEGVRLDLRRLDAAALHTMVAARYSLPDADEARLVAYLEQHAEGNPFFASEILRALEEDTRLCQVHDSWTLEALDRVVVPPFLRQVIDGRVARLGEAIRQPLAMAAVIGQDIPLALWAQVADLDDEALLAIVEQAVEANLLEAAPDGMRVRFVHALTREALYEGVLPPRRRLWHRRVAETLMVSANPDPDAVAYHLQQAGDPRAPEWLVKAADRAQQAYAWLTAVERLQAAAALLTGVEGQERACCRLALRIGWMERFSDPVGAIPGLDDALRAAARIGDQFLIAELHWARSVLLFYSDRFTAADEELSWARQRLDLIEGAALDQASAAAAPSQAWAADGLPPIEQFDATIALLSGERPREAGQRFRRGALLWAAASRGQVRTAIEADEAFVASADTSRPRGGTSAIVAFTCHALGIVNAALGDPEKAHQMWSRANELFAGFDHHALVAFSVLHELHDVALTYGAAIPMARRELAAKAEAALSRAGGALAPGVSPRLAWLSCFVLDGHWEEALAILQDIPTPGNNYLRREVSGPHATIARLRGNPATAWQRIVPLFPQGPTTEPGDLIHQEGLFLQRLAADLCLDAGNLRGAHAWLMAHDAWLAWSESVLGRADGCLAWARYHREAGDVDRARVSAEEALALASTPDQPLVRLAAHRLLGEIETAVNRHAEAEQQLISALQLADSCEAHFERALTFLALAELRLAMGDFDEAATRLEEVRQICTSLGAAPTLARVDALTPCLSTSVAAEPYPAGLTQREVDVLRLLPRGLSNAEIADELFLSPRTVQTHLTNLYGKLGVGGRAEAVAYAMAHDLV